MKTFDSQKLPIKLWMQEATDLESGAWDQVKNLANLPFAYHHIAIMPDAHQGYGMPIGGVLATKDVIVPNAVGVDIGCGMCAVKTSLTEISTEQLKTIMGKIREVIPVGMNHQKQAQDMELMPHLTNHVAELDYLHDNLPIVYREYTSALSQIGTLGGGNHFIEIQKGSDGHVWIMIHSGSRNFGLQIAKYYNDIAIVLNESWHTKVPKAWELAFLPIESPHGQAYIREMRYAVDFALANRKLMMDRIINIFTEEWKFRSDALFTVDPMINIAHNYASLERHLGHDVWVHRKGATLARVDTIGIIPGSQGTSSYIVKGKGNVESFESCSHGAGRLMGRNVARKTLNLEDEKKRLDDQGIIHSIRNEQDLDEAAGAYKPIETVMANQSDLVDILVELKPLAVIKG